MSQVSEKNISQKRSESIKVSLTLSEKKVYNMKFQKLNSFFSENNLFLNEPELLRVILLSLDDPDFKQSLLKLYHNDCRSIFKARL